MPEKPVFSTIRDYGLEVAKLDLSDKRAAEVALEVGALNRATLEAATHLDLNDEPGQFALALVRNRQPRGKTK
jgi:hypothetical protein